MMRRELPVFLVVGALTVLVDLLVYRALMAAGLATAPAKAAGFLAGTVFAYCANRRWTFGHRPASRASAARFAVLYGATLAANVAVNAAVLRMLGANGAALAVPLAFVAATGISAMLNFIGMKTLVFSHTRRKELP
ncbi:GtrA family protein [Rugamonas sp. FT82W]|uniref:GtrA family protein n=1 Tax=Duganella vulcania TaxID=2692166 RepID=A0A845FZG2_9BURK|nr:GtrA family protein [Duganella vulcania]MYM86006.1 GtrA family protein [Duganella vulcania]